MDMPLKKTKHRKSLKLFCLRQKIKITISYIFNSTFCFFFFFLVDPESNNKYDSFSNLDKVIISLGITDRPEKGLPTWLSGKESLCQYKDTRDMGLIPGLE